MKIIKPKKLKKGDTIAILAISGKINEYERIEQAKSFFEKEGYNVIISESCKTFHRYLAGSSDDDCVNTLHSYFQDENIDMILCARGGFGCIRLLDKINFEIIKNNPKIFAGYSDITALLNLIYKKTGMITFHSPMPYGDFSCDISCYTKDSFINILEGNKTKIIADKPIVYKEGIVEGILYGGNLATLASLCGIDFVPDEDLILFLEDLNEPVYKIDRMLSQFFNVQRIKENVKGIVLGEFKDIDNVEYYNDVIFELTNKLNIPICGGFKITHGCEKDTVPIGNKVLFDSKKGVINFLEDFVK